jgi:hypothetical protein
LQSPFFVEMVLVWYFSSLTDGAEEGIRTPTMLPPPAPQAGASASSATSACGLPCMNKVERIVVFN